MTFILKKEIKEGSLSLPLLYFSIFLSPITSLPDLSLSLSLFLRLKFSSLSPCNLSFTIPFSSAISSRWKIPWRRGANFCRLSSPSPPLPSLSSFILSLSLPHDFFLILISLSSLFHGSPSLPRLSPCSLLSCVRQKISHSSPHSLLSLMRRNPPFLQKLSLSLFLPLSQSLLCASSFFCDLFATKILSRGGAKERRGTQPLLPSPPLPTHMRTYRKGGKPLLPFPLQFFLLLSPPSLFSLLRSLSLSLSLDLLMATSSSLSFSISSSLSLHASVLFLVRRKFSIDDIILQIRSTVQISLN